MRRLLLVPVGMLLGFLAGSVVLVGGVAALAAGAPVQTGRAMLDALAWAAAVPDHGDVMLPIGIALWRALITVCLGPIGLVALLGEVTGRRSLVALSGLTGLLAVVLPVLAIAGRETGWTVTLEGSGRVLALLFLSGVASGAAYWLVAAAPVSVTVPHE